MKHYKLIKWLFLFVFSFLVLSPRVFALAGFAEFSSTLHYNKYADIHWMNPSDGCRPYHPYGQHCFYLIEKKELKTPFNETLQKISVPQGPGNPLVLMESSHSRWFGQGRWFIYDLASRGIIFEAENFELALKEWGKLGFSDPELANAKNLSDYFEETEDSKVKNNEGDLVFVIIIAIAFGGIFTVMILSLILIFNLTKIVIVTIRNQFITKSKGEI